MKGAPSQGPARSRAPGGPALPFLPWPALVLATVWTVLVWANWLPGFPLSAAQWAEAVEPWMRLTPGAVVASLARHARWIGLVGLLAAAAVTAGSAAVRWLAGARGGVTLRLAVGAGALALTTLGAGLASVLFPGVGWVAVGAAALPALRRIRRPAVGWALRPATLPLTAVLGAALGLVFTGALAPEASFDGIAHHLAHPEIYAAHHRIHALPHHFLANVPALAEMHYLLARLLAGGMEPAKLIHFGWGLVALGALVGWARESLEDHWALAVGAVFMLIPYALLVGQWSYVDLAAAALVTIALREALAPRPRRILLGVVCGLAAGTKLTGVFGLAIVLAILAVRGRSIAGLLISFLMATAPWGMKNLLMTGNPVAPFVPGLFPTLWWETGNHARYRAELASYNTGSLTLPGLGGFLARGWDVSIRNTGVLDTWAGMGAWFLWGLPLLLLVGAPAARGPALAACGWFVLWHLIPRQVRYTLPAWPAAALATAHAARELAARGWPARGLVAGLALILLWHLPLGVRMQFEDVHPVAVAWGGEPAASYLAGGMPGKGNSLALRGYLQAHPGGRLLVADQYGLGAFWGAEAYVQSFFDEPLVQRFAREARTPGEIGKRFRELGITRVLCDQENQLIMQTSYAMFAFDDPSAARWREWWTTHARLESAQGSIYLLYRLERLAVAGGTRPAAWPGLDEQWLAAPEAMVTAAERANDLAGVARAGEGYARVAAATGSPLAWERHGAVLLRLGRWRDAERVLREAGRRGRDSAKLHDSLGIAAANQGRMPEAAREFGLALVLDPGFDSARRNLALAEARLSRR